jgi:hypothetical protein
VRVGREEVEALEAAAGPVARRQALQVVLAPGGDLATGAAEDHVVVVGAARREDERVAVVLRREAVGDLGVDAGALRGGDGEGHERHLELGGLSRTWEE